MKSVWNVKSASRWPNSRRQRISMLFRRQVEHPVPGRVGRDRGVVAAQVPVQRAGAVLRQDLQEVLEHGQGLGVAARLERGDAFLIEGQGLRPVGVELV